MYSNYLNSNSGIAGHALKIKKITASAALSANDSGSIILVNPAAATKLTFQVFLMLVLVGTVRLY